MDQYEIDPPDGGYGWVVLGKFRPKASSNVQSQKYLITKRFLMLKMLIALSTHLQTQSQFFFTIRYKTTGKHRETVVGQGPVLVEH